MPYANLVVGSLIGFFIGLYLFYRGFFWFREKRMMENIPTSKIRSIAMGPVEIFGKAYENKKNILLSPFSEKNCIFYKYSIQELRSSGKSSRWVTIKEGSSSDLFFIKDETGVVMVDPKGADVDIPLDFKYDSALGKDPPAVVMKFLKNNNLSFEGVFGMNKTMRFMEYFIAPNDQVYVLGTAGNNPYYKVKAKNEQGILIQKGKDFSFYYISDQQEKTILGKLRWKALGGIIGGPLLSIVCLIIILIYFGFF